VPRVPAAEIEDIVLKSLNAHLITQGERPVSATNDRSAIVELITRIDVHKDQLAVRLRSRENPGTIKPTDDIESTDNRVLSIPWQKPPSKRFRQILLPHGVSRSEVRPERPERRHRLVRANRATHCFAVGSNDRIQRRTAQRRRGSQSIPIENIKHFPPSQAKTHRLSYGGKSPFASASNGRANSAAVRVLPFAIMSVACAGRIFGAAAFAASSICLTLVAILVSSKPPVSKVISSYAGTSSTGKD
jgi:hypothetical protein